jgi:hypothetical protein
MSDLVGHPLRYLIGLDSDGEGTLVETGYDATKPSGVIGCKYCNLRDENDVGSYGPYLPPDDIDEEYNEPAPDPEHDGFWRNLREQLERAVEQGFIYVELDNLDTYDVDVSLKCFDECVKRGLDVFVKNPLMVEGSNVELLKHDAAVLVIVEKDCGLPRQMHMLRHEAGKPELPIRFVSYGRNRSWAVNCAAAITRDKLRDMGVTHSPHGEYRSSEDVLKPQLNW